jgi:DNA-directed RNA polymerase II subunit RPB11
MTQQHVDLYPELMPAKGEKLEYEEVENMVNAGRITIFYEDHTLGNCVRTQLLRDPDVTFAGYRMPHPLYPKCEIRIQTTDNSTPKQAFQTAVRDLIDHVTSLETSYTEQLKIHQVIPNRQ